MNAAAGVSGVIPANHRGVTPITVYTVSPDPQLRAERVPASAVFRLPHAVAQHDDRLAIRRQIFSLIEIPAKNRWCVEEAEEARRDAGDQHVASVFGRADRETGTQVGRGAYERLASGGERSDASIRHSIKDEVAVEIRIRIREVDEMRAIGVAQHRRGAEQQTIDDGEHRRVRADAESERDDDRGREGGTRAQSTNRVAEIVPQRIEERRISLVRVAHMTDSTHSDATVTTSPSRSVTARRASSSDIPRATSLHAHVRVKAFRPLRLAGRATART